MQPFHERLKAAMSFKHMTQSELCEITKIPKSAMSQYVSGSFIPKQERTYLIAKALNVNEPWLMGYDVPMERPKLTTNEELKFALFEGSEGVTDEMFEEVKQFAAMVKMREDAKKEKK